MENWRLNSGRCRDVRPHDTLTLVGAGAVKDTQVAQHYTCTRCGAAFARILKGEPRKQVWVLLNAGQH
ncbi:hypothetical protein CA603_12685 [Paraburkholderia hospita]|nr:hypothetical protein CA603_12685 [Paraburkholderia hospita]